VIYVQKFIDLECSEQLEILHQTLEEGWSTGKTDFLLSGLNHIVKERFLQDLIDTYQTSLIDKNKEDFSKLFSGFSKYHGEEIIYNNLIQTMMRVVFLNQIGTVGSERKEANEKGNYEYVPYRRGRFLALLNAIMTKIPYEIDFLDVGSGIGDKTMLASLHPRIKFSYGIELNQHTYELSKFFLDKFHRSITFNPRIFIRFLNIDGLEFERKFVGKERRILFYSYVPIYNHKKLTKLYERFLTQMKIGDYYWEIASDIRVVDKRKFNFIVSNKFIREPVWEKVGKNTFKEILCD